MEKTLLLLLIKKVLKINSSFYSEVYSEDR